MSDRIFIRNGTVVTMNDADDMIFGGSVVIEGDRIVDVGPDAEVAARQSTEGAVVIEAEGKAVMPGLVDLHFHTAVGKGWSDHLPLWEYLETCWYPIIRALNPEEAYWAALASYSESIKCGVTTVNDMYRQLGGLARAAEEIGIRAVLSNDVADDEHNLDTLEDNKVRLRDLARRRQRPDRGLRRDRVAPARLRGPPEGDPHAGRRPQHRHPHPPERVAHRGGELEAAVRPAPHRGRVRLRDPVRPLHRRALRLALRHRDRVDARDRHADLPQPVRRTPSSATGSRACPRCWRRASTWDSATTRRSATTAATCSR